MNSLQNLTHHSNRERQSAGEIDSAAPLTSAVTRLDPAQGCYN